MNYKKLVTTLTVILLLAAACNKPAQVYDQTQNNTSTPPGQNQQPQSTEKTIFTDDQNKVVLDYTNLSVQSSVPSSYFPAQNNFTKDGKNILTLYLNPDVYKGTNLESAWLNLATNQSITSKECYTGYTSLRTVQNNSWHYGRPNPIGNAGAGHSQLVETYRLYKNNICYEVALAVSGFNRSNLENPDSVKEYDRTKMLNYLGAVFNQLQVK